MTHIDPGSGLEARSTKISGEVVRSIRLSSRQGPLAAGMGLAFIAEQPVSLGLIGPMLAAGRRRSTRRVSRFW